MWNVMNTMKYKLLNDGWPCPFPTHQVIINQNINRVNKEKYSNLTLWKMKMCNKTGLIQVLWEFRGNGIIILIKTVG